MTQYLDAAIKAARAAGALVRGDLEKYSIGTTLPYVSFSDGSSFIQVVYSSGSTEGGNTKEVLVIRANGLVVGRRSGEWYDPGVLDTKLEPGDVVVVPQKVFGGSAMWRNLFASAQVLSSVGFAAALALH